jgi:heme oxygenase
MKLATQDYHKRIEKTPLLNKLIHRKADLADYKNLLLKYYGYIYPCEQEVCRLKTEGLSFDDRLKNKVLKHDLCLLGLKPEHFTQLKYCCDLPTLNNEGQLLGYFYVMEGATLGGQILLPIIDNILGSSARKANLYFSGYGDHTRIKWQEFCDHLNKYSKNHGVVIDAIETAIATFTCFDKWLTMKTEESSYDYSS